MARSLIQLGITDRETLAAARRHAGGEGVLTQLIANGVGGLMPSVPPIVLSTCERLEVYALCRSDEVRATAGAIGHHIGNSVRLERRIGEAAVAHLFSVASGLESRLIGEPHILGQVSRAAAGFEEWGGEKAAARLERLFQDAVACGRRARAASGLDRLAVSCVDLAVDRARAVLNASGANAAVVGSGAIARETALGLRGAGFDVTVFARHHERAAEGVPASVRTAPLDALPAGMSSVGLLIAATSSHVPIVSGSHLASRHGPLLLIDLGVPANIEADVARLPGVRIVTLDDLLIGRARPEHLIALSRAVVHTRAARWSRRWLGGDIAEPAVLPRSTVA